jgi:hypothetical protein
MESIDTEICLESGKCDRKGRRIRGAHEWSLILKRYNESGLTQNAFCAREGLKYGTLVAWLGRRRKKVDLSGEGSVTKPKFQELSLNGLPDSGNAQLEVALPDGVVVRGAQASQLAELVQLLRA